MINRINNPDKVTEKSVLSTKGAWGLPTIQFSKSGQSKGLLKSINSLCKVFGEKLPVRFYGHYQNGFDASVLKHLPDVQWLLIDCLQDISNSEAVFQLPKLKRRRERKAQRFRSIGSAQKQLSCYGQIYNLFNHQRHLITRKHSKSLETKPRQNGTL